jgi:hypothetical protein
MKKLFLVIALFFLLVFGVLSYNNCFAATHTVSGDCSASAVNAVIAAADEGDIIDVTCSGTVTWSSTITLSGGKTLRGGGTKGASGTAGTWPLTINVTYSGQSYDDALIKVVNTDTQPLNRVTGFKFQGTGNPTYIIWVYGKGTGTDGKGAFRIDNNYFNSAAFKARLIGTNGTTGKLTGLLDHNVLYYPKSGSPAFSNNAYVNSYKGSSGTCYGYDSLHRAVGFGTDDFVFWEDNYLLNTTIETSAGGGRAVVRYNEITSDYTDGSRPIFDGHGADTKGTYSCGVVANEFYKNTITGATAFAQVVDMRGGQWMVHNNTTESGRLQINELRVTKPTYLDWKECSGTWCCETPKCDIQAPTASDFASCYPLPNQVRNTYVWNNLKAGTNMIPVPTTSTVDIYVALNRDYWIATSGLKSALPGTCATGAGFWATDENVLYKCTATNTWTEYYTPYTYPHPLRSETDEVAPTAKWAIDATGLIATATFNETVNATTKTGVSFTGTVTGAITATYKDGMPGGIVRYDLNKEVQQGETIVVDYTTPGDGIKDLAGNALDDIADGEVMNSSTQSTPPLVTLEIGAHTGATVNVYPGINCGSTCSADYDNGAVLTVSVTALPNYTGCTIGGTTGCGASTTMNEAKTCTVTCTKIAADNKVGSAGLPGHRVGAGNPAHKRY